MNKMYVGNLPFSVTEDELRDAFSSFGSVTDVHLVTDRETGRPRGFAFVTMDSSESMEAAIRGLDGQEFAGRNLSVNEARPREERGGGGGNFRSGGGNNFRSGGGNDRNRRGSNSGGGGGRRW